MALAALLVLSLVLPSPCLSEYAKTDFLVRPRSLNRRGIVGPGRICPKNTYAIGFKMKVVYCLLKQTTIFAPLKTKFVQFPYTST